MGGFEPTCLMDFWMIETVREIREAEAEGLPRPRTRPTTTLGSTCLTSCLPRKTPPPPPSCGASRSWTDTLR